SPPPQTPPEPSSRRPSGAALVAIAVVIGLIVGFGVVLGIVSLTGSGSKSPQSSAALPQSPAATAPPVFTAPTTTTPADPSATVLPGLVIQQADLASGYSVQQLQGGDQVSGQTTLDLCNGTFPSEALRSARLQVVAVDGQGNDVVSTEAVLYKTPADAAQAFAELKSVTAACPSTPVVSPVGEPTVTTKFNAAPDGTWPQTPTVERLAFDFVTTDAAGQTQHNTAVYLHRGRALMGIYFAAPDQPQPAIAGQTTIPSIVTVFADRLAQLPATAVNG
ncbi:MAG: hypothetical protein ACHQNA_00570, partial [Acidimicrobiales bacterium]